MTAHASGRTESFNRTR
jgi:hypothetical protein